MVSFFNVKWSERVCYQSSLKISIAKDHVWSHFQTFQCWKNDAQWNIFNDLLICLERCSLSCVHFVHSNNFCGNIASTRESVSSGYRNTEKRVESTTRSGVFFVMIFFSLNLMNYWWVWEEYFYVGVDSWRSAENTQRSSKYPTHPKPPSSTSSSSSFSSRGLQRWWRTPGALSSLV